METQIRPDTDGKLCEAIKTLHAAFGTRFEVIIQPSCYKPNDFVIVRPVSVMVGNVEYKIVTQEKSLGLDTNALKDIIAQGTSPGA